MAMARLLSRTVIRHKSTLVNTYFKSKKTSQHLAPTSLCQRHIQAGAHIVTQPGITDASRWPLYLEPARCLHTGVCRRNYEITQEGEQPSSPSGSQPNTARKIVQHWTQRLDAEQVPEAKLAAQYIVSYVLGVTKNELQRPDVAQTVLSKEEMQKVERFMLCRLARMPLQYILGEWDFHDVTLKVVPPVFIPRPETEHLVELAIKILKDTKSARVLDVCCGSGTLCLALLHSLPQLECVAIDQSIHAVKLTKENATQLGLNKRLTVVKGKVTMDDWPTLPYSTYNLVVSNPPYVSTKDLMNLQPEIMMYEDLRALYGGKDGLDIIKAVVHFTHNLLLPGGKLLMEVDSPHAYMLPAWLETQNLQLSLVQVHKDFNKKDRIVELVKAP